MSQIEISIDQGRNEFVLTGALTEFISNRRLKFYFFNSLRAHLDNEEIRIPYDRANRERELKSLQDALLKYGVETSQSTEIKDVLANFFYNEDRFKRFSLAARNIWHNKIEADDFSTFKKVIDARFLRRLYDKQLLAAFHLAFSQNACNFSVPGAGKTSMVYAAFSYLNSLPSDDPKFVNRILVIGPLSSFGPWEEEYEECFGEKPRSMRLSGGMTPEDRKRYFLSVEPVDKLPILNLMSYQSLSSNLSNIIHFLERKGQKTMVVLDEAHRIKNPDGVWASAALQLAKYCSSRIVLTGTPLPHGYDDIYNLYEFIWPEREIVNFNIDQLKDMSEHPHDPRIEQLVENISPFFIRIKKSHLGLPPVIENPPILVKMGPAQREIYDRIEQSYIASFGGEQKSIFNNLAKAKCIRLLQAATDPSLLRQPLDMYFQEQGMGSELNIDDRELMKKILQYRDQEPIPNKFIETKNLVGSFLSRGEKVVIWAVFISNILTLQKYLASCRISSEILIGETPVENEESEGLIKTREKIVRQFNDPTSGLNVVIANPSAVAESISLHKACHNAIYLERTFNAANFIQSKDRIHRVGLNPGILTNYFYVISEDSIDLTVHRRLGEKVERMMTLIENRDIPLFAENLNYDIDIESDIKAILRDYLQRSAQIKQSR